MSARQTPATEEMARLREEVLDLGHALATLTGEVYEQRLALMGICAAFAKARRVQALTVPDQIAKFAPAVMKAAPAPASLGAVKGGGCRSAPRRPALHLVAEVDR